MVFFAGILIFQMMHPESIYYLFETGHKSKQEDYIWPIPGKATVNDRVFIVCDGAGNVENGEIASKLVCQFMVANVLKFGEQKMSGELINRLLIEARDRLIAHAREYRLDTDLATTFSMLILYEKKVLMSWYGDSRIYHLRRGEILFRTEDNSLVSEPMRNTVIARGIRANNSPINAETKWIEDLQDDDYFLLCSKGISESVTDDDIKLLVSQNDKATIDLTGSFRRLASEKTPENYSMYLIKVNVGAQKKEIKGGSIAIRKQTSGIFRPVFILAITIIGLLIVVSYFRNAAAPNPVPKDRNKTTHSVVVQRDDSVPNAIVMSTPRKPILRAADSVKKAVDSVKNIGENPPAAPQNEHSAAIQTEEKPEQTSPTPVGQKKPVAQLLIKFTTEESCKLKITNLDLDEVIDWDLSQDDNGTIFLKPGKYSIVATSLINSSKTKTYDFDVKPGNAHTAQNIHIRF